MVIHCTPSPFPSPHLIHPPLPPSLTTHSPPSQPGAANRFPDKVDADPAGTRALNIEASRALAQHCAARNNNTLLVYISTDYVFAGRPGDAPYEADAPTGPTNLYGQTKLDGEEAVLGAFESLGKEGRGVVLRVPVLYGEVEGGRNGESAVNVLMDVVLGKGKAGEVGMDHWALRYPTNTEDVARVCYGGFFFFFFFFFCF